MFMQIRLVPIISVAVAIAASGALAGCASSGAAKKASPATIEVEMNAMAFQPAQLNVPAGQTVTFRFHNRSQVVHEALIGDSTMQDAHEQEMKSMGQMAMGGSDMVTVQPGATATLQHRFSGAGSLIIGCHEPGHYSAGMRATVTVA
jgi:uncharacterized cupredoxin-like copper-binding protein